MQFQNGILNFKSLWPNGGFQYLLLFDLNDMPHPLCGTPVSGFNPRCSTVDWDKISQYLDFADLSLNEKLDINFLLQIQLHVLNLLEEFQYRKV